MFLLGQWRNFEEMEDNLTLDEMGVILEAARKSEFAKQKFAAALKGVNLGEPGGDEEALTFEDIKRRAEAKSRGVSEEELEFGEVGFAVIQEE